jgi:histidinol-phosphate aminotransferase
VSGFDLPLRKDLLGQTPYGAPDDSVPVRLNVNENPYPPSEKVIAAISQAVAVAARGINRYPDREVVDLRAALASYLLMESGINVNIERIWAANGSNEIMAQLFSAFGGPGTKALTFDPTYSMYPEYGRDSFTEMVSIPRRRDFTIDLAAAIEAVAEHKPTLVILTSPNNPTGTSITLAEIKEISQAAQAIGALVVVDEAYAEFRGDRGATALTLLDSYPNIVVSRTMSKAFGYAGGRLGYCAASSSDIVQALKLVRLPYHLSAISQAAAIAALGFASESLERVAEITNARNEMASELVNMGLVVAQSDANFLFFGEFADRHAIWNGLFEQGILIRETGPSGWLRVSIGTASENELFVNCLKALVCGQEEIHDQNGTN